jgi:UDP-N-acetylmuramoyl-tripeptide--D-alanyl-D-alanine ligase
MKSMFTLEDVRVALGPELLSLKPAIAVHPEALEGPLNSRDALRRPLRSRRGRSRATPTERMLSFSAIANDSRVAKPGELFVALETDVRDGHNFVADAVGHGVTGVIVSREVDVPDDVTLFLVRDTKHGLGELARYWRGRFIGLKTIVITGNVGKTSTKELTAALLSRFFTVLKSPANFNDEIGLSMALFQLTDAHQRAVLEVGMDHLGEIRRSCEIAQPDSAVVLNVGPTHLERLGSLEAIADAKAEAVEALSDTGTAFLNADDPYVSAMASRTRGRIVTFGIEKEADFRATDISSRGLDGVDFTIVSGGKAVAAHSPLPGARLVSNALAAVAAVTNEGIGLEDAVHALGEIEVPARLQTRWAANGALILDDSYNAGPPSMLAALSVLAETPGRRIALLGDMLELGSAEAEGHRSIGERAAAVADLLFTVGQRGRLISDAARATGAAMVEHFNSKEDAVRELQSLLRPGDVLLVKASHGLALHTVVEALVSSQEASHA